MGRRNNSGYIGQPVGEVEGVIDREKNYQIRYLSQNETFASDTSLLTGAPIPDTTTFNYFIASASAGSGSIVTASLVNGSIASLTAYANGTGYGTNITLSFSGGGGTGADGFATLTGGAISAVERLGVISDYIITNGGSGYTSNPTVTVSAQQAANGNAGVRAIVSASITDGRVTSLTIHNTGSQYRGGSNYPTFTFSGGGSPTVTAQDIPILRFGQNYTSAPIVTVTGAGSGAIVSSSIYGFLSSSLIITSGGAGYTTTPSVVIDGAYLVDTSGSVTLSGDAVSTVSINSGSSTFNTPPAVTITGLPDLPSVTDNQIVGWVAVRNDNSNWNAFNITTNGGGGYTVNWGDGTSNNYNTNVTASKQYTTASFAALTSSVYNGYKPALVTITLSGSATSFATVNFTTRPTLPTGSYNNFSAGAATNNWVDVKMAGSQVTSLVFGTSTANFLTSGLLERFEYSGSNRITNFGNLFSNCFNLKQVVSVYTTSGSAFTNAFQNCYNLVSLPPIDCTGVGSSTVSLNAAFNSCTSLETITLTNTSKLTDLTSIFNGCVNLKDINIPNNTLPPSVTTYQSAFAFCYNLTKLPIIDATNVTNFSNAFNSSTALDEIIIIGSTSRCTTFGSCFAGCANLRRLPKSFDCRSVTSTGLGTMFSSCAQLKQIPILLNTRNATSMDFMFFNCRSLAYIPLFDAQNVTTLQSTFSGCTALKTIPPFNFSRVTTFSGTFNGCTSLSYIPAIDTSNATNVSSMFNTCISLLYIPLLNTTKVTNMSNMFFSCISLKTIPKLDTQNVTDANGMFSGCTSLQDVPLLNTANVTNFSNMFASCASLKYVPLLNTSNATNVGGMFTSCRALQTIPSFDFRRVTATLSNFAQSCLNLKTVGALNVSAATDYNSMFNASNNLQSIGPITFSTSTSAVYTNIFLNCQGLRRIQASNIANNITLSNCLLSSNELDEIYTGLATVGAPGSNTKTITVTGNWGTPNDNPSIATAKGWQVTG